MQIEKERMIELAGAFLLFQITHKEFGGLKPTLDEFIKNSKNGVLEDEAPEFKRAVRTYSEKGQGQEWTGAEQELDLFALIPQS
ncbi:hypothetical protein ACFL22_01075 [Patescibacteria group bacterium]